MPCPHSRSAAGPSDDSRREFLKAAVAIGGTSALSACANLTDNQVGAATPQFPQGPSDLSTLPARQHAWGDYLVTDRQSNVVPPRHHVFLLLDYARDGVPTDADRETVETALRTLERAHRRGTGDRANAIENDGLLFMLGYAPAYFQRFDASLPDSVDLPSPERVLDELDDDPAKADDADALLHVASDRAQVVLSVEEALFGDLDRLNGVDVPTDLTGVFERADRRAGFTGAGLPEERLDHDAVAEEAPASMGFKSKFADTAPGEDKVTIREGPFAGGTTQHVSKLEIDLDSWYDHDREGRVERMFSPEHTTEDVGDVGEGLGRDSGVTEDLADRTEEYAAREGVVGHAQKTVRARDDDFEPVILRRGDFNAPAEPGSVLHFGAIQEEVTDFVRTRKAMDDIHFGTDEGDGDAGTDRKTNAPSVAPEDDGILGFIEVHNRANFLVPPRDLRALPPARP